MNNPSKRSGTEYINDEKRRRQTMAFRRVLAAKKGDPNEPTGRHIRFDYSDIRLENENLDMELEMHESSLHREKFQKNVDNEQNFKQVKKDAEAMLQLKEAVNKRKPNTSFDRVVKSANIRKESRVKTPKEKSRPPSSATAKPDSKEDVVDNVDASAPVYESDSDSSSESDEEQTSKPFNNLTMFLLSLQTYKYAGHRGRGEGVLDGRDIKDEGDKHVRKKHDDVNSRPSSFVPRSKSAIPRTRSAMPGSRRPAGPKSAMPRARSAIQAEVCEKYGIHVQKDLSRSRRTLGEISKLEHDTKFKHIDKFESRRKKMLAECKDTDNLDTKIDNFLKGIDEFKKVSRADNSLEKVLMRSKSAYGLRIPATELPSINVL